METVDEDSFRCESSQLMGLGREAEGALTSLDYQLEEIRQIGTDRTCTLVKRD
jgi:hypothetical protein